MPSCFELVLKLAGVSNTLERPASGDWVELERELQCDLPADLKELLSTVGAGTFGEFSLFSPVSESKYTRLSKERTMLYYQDVRKVAIEAGLVLFPEPSGFLRIGSCPHSMDLLVRPICDAAEAHLAWFDRDFRSVRFLPMSVPQFLHDLYTEKIPEEWARELRALLWEPGEQFFTPGPSRRIAN